MKGIIVCFDGEKSLKKELSELDSRDQKPVKKGKNSLFPALKLLSKPISKLEILRR